MRAKAWHCAGHLSRGVCRHASRQAGLALFRSSGFLEPFSRPRQESHGWHDGVPIPLQLRRRTTASKQTHHQHHEEPPSEPTHAPKVAVDPFQIPHYDLKDIPNEFEDLRWDPETEAEQWIEAIVRILGPESVSQPHSTHCKHHYRIEHHGMYYLLHAAKHQVLSPREKKALLDALAHMHVFGSPTPKAGPRTAPLEEELEEPPFEEGQTEDREHILQDVEQQMDVRGNEKETEEDDMDLETPPPEIAEGQGSKTRVVQQIVISYSPSILKRGRR